MFILLLKSVEVTARQEVHTIHHCTLAASLPLRLLPAVASLFPRLSGTGELKAVPQS